MDKCTARGHIKVIKAIQIEPPPQNTTAIPQPMDQGVIWNLKHHYKSYVLSRMALRSDNRKSHTVDLRSAIGMPAES